MDFRAAGFTKYGFYLARGFLEQKRPGEQFPELVYGPEATACVIPDWQEFGDPDPTPPEEYIHSASFELERPAGTWTPLNETGAEDGTDVEAEDGAGTEAEEGEATPAMTPETIEALRGIDFSHNAATGAPAAPDQ